MSTGKWRQQNVPHKGWRCVSWYDVKELDGDLQICEMCEVNEIRFVHVMVHNDYHEELQVGCVCAEHMELEYATTRLRPQARDRAMSKRAGRRKRWLDLQAWHQNRKGNWVIVKNGLRATVFYRNQMWNYVLSDQFGPGHYRTSDEARRALFVIFDKVANPQDYPD